MMSNADKLVSAILRCDPKNHGDGYAFRVDGKTHRPNTAIEAGGLISAHKGLRIRYRVYSFADKTHGFMVAAIY